MIGLDRYMGANNSTAALPEAKTVVESKSPSGKKICCACPETKVILYLCTISGRHCLTSSILNVAELGYSKSSLSED